MNTLFHLLSGPYPAGSLLGGPLGWLWIERSAIVGAFLVTLGRLALTLLLGLLAGALLAALMRLSRPLEALLTPWLLTALAVPWLLVLVAINIIPSVGLSERTALVTAAAACAVQVWALGQRKLPERRSQYLGRAVWFGTGAVLMAELLTRTTGLGAQLRYYSLFTQVSHLLLYAGLIVLLCVLAFAFERLLRRLLARTFLWRAG